MPVHGDFYEAQVLVDAGRVVGLLDVDTAGAGHRVDDLAALVAHLSILSITDAFRAAGPYGDRVLADGDRQVDPVALRLRVAAAVVALASGPFRVLEPGWRRVTAQRLDLAEAWMASASRGGSRAAPRR